MKFGWFEAAVGAFVAVGLAAAVYFLMFDKPDGAPAQRLWADPSNAELVALGKKVYAAQCASCHGAKLEGEGNWRRRKPDGTLPAPPHDETGHTWHHPDWMLFEYTKYGGERFTRGVVKSAMPGFGDTLSDREIYAVLAYIKSLWPEDVRERQARISEAQKK